MSNKLGASHTNTYKALAELGVKVSSSLSAANLQSDAALSVIGNVRQKIVHVTEVPILSFSALKFGRNLACPNKSLTITGVGFEETKDVIKDAVAQRVEDIVILTHPFEFIKRGDAKFRKITLSRVNQSRLKKLCRWIAETETVTTADFKSSIDRWLSATVADDVKIESRPLSSIVRVIENKLNDIIWQY
ncbi:polysaccharide deacetylase family protein [Kordiimonas aquimaris]|uniref:hypothetical protein n=1 Tax=Kordiimonas aquimaris TaxID=707591 RepID=UPI0021CF3DCD|nr:hypothetical protein [Kordiimonas aquimaris]